MDTEKYNCLVVDDEPIARKIINNYIQQLPALNLYAESISAVGAIEHLGNGNEVDIIFLDINMPNLSGLQLLKILQPRQPVILTTAYTEFAVESYELNAVDYLLKPFSFERFTRAVYKAIAAIRSANKTYELTGEKRQLFIKSDGKNYPVYIEDILYCEAMKNYTIVVLKDKRKLMPLIPLSKFDKLLSESGGGFVQVHRSFIVSIKHITTISSSSVNIYDNEIPLGVQFKEKFYQAIGMNSI